MRVPSKSKTLFVVSLFLNYSTLLASYSTKTTIRHNGRSYSLKLLTNKFKPNTTGIPAATFDQDKHHNISLTIKHGATPKREYINNTTPRLIVGGHQWFRAAELKKQFNITGSTSVEHASEHVGTGREQRRNVYTPLAQQKRDGTYHYPSNSWFLITHKDLTPKELTGATQRFVKQLHKERGESAVKDLLRPYHGKITRPIQKKSNTKRLATQGS